MSYERPPLPWALPTTLTSERDWRRWNGEGLAEHGVWGYGEGVAQEIEVKARAAEKLARKARSIQADAEAVGAAALANQMAVSTRTRLDACVGVSRCPIGSLWPVLRT